MSDPTDFGKAPVLAVAGGAGVMGSLFAELLLPSIDACLLVDRFATGSTGDAASSTPLAPLVERLTLALARQGLEVRIVARDASGSPTWLAPREARLAPAWLVAFAPSTEPKGPPGVPAKPREALDRLRTIPGVRKVIGLLTPVEATLAAELCDVLLVATHYGGDDQFAALLAPYVAGLRPGSLVTDLLSVKEGPLAVLCRMLPRGVGLLGSHPLFGRTAGDVTGLVVAVVPAPGGRPVVRWQHWLLTRLAELGMLVTPTGAAEHDAAMSFVQALTHFALLCFAYTFVRANQDPTQLLPYRTPVFEPLLYLAARVAALAQRSPEVYRAIQAECARPELRRLFVQTAQELLAAIEGDEMGRWGDGEVGSGHAPAPKSGSHHLPIPASPHLIDLFQSLGAPWAGEVIEPLVAMSASLTEPVNALRHELLRSAGTVRAIRNTRTGAVILGAVYVDPLHHDRIDLASRLRYRRFNLTSGTLESSDPHTLAGLSEAERRRQIEASLGSLPLAQVQMLSEPEMLAWLNAIGGPRSGPDDYRGLGRPAQEMARRPERARYIGKAHFDLSLAVPAWFDDDCLQRLLVGREAGCGQVTVATVAPQDASGLAVGAGQRAATIKLAVVLRPQEILDLRQAAHRQAVGEHPEGSRGQQRRHSDRQFVALVKQRQLDVRQAALDWLLAHGCSALRAGGPVGG